MNIMEVKLIYLFFYINILVNYKDMELEGKSPKPKSKKAPKTKKVKEKLKLKPRGVGKKCLENSNASLNKKAKRLMLKSWVLPNRTGFIEWMNSTYSEPFNLSRSVSSTSGQFPHQEFVTNYIGHNSPYRGLLLYHGLGAGKTASSVAITDGLSHDKQIVVMLPASLRTNYVNEIRRWGNILYKENVYYCFVPASRGSKMEKLLEERGIPLKWIRKKGRKGKRKIGAWMIDTKKRSRNKTLSDEDNEEIKRQIDYLLDYKYKILHYNNRTTLIQQIFERVGGHKKIGKITRDELRRLVHDATIKDPETNPFNDKVLVVDEIHNLISMMIGGGFNGPLIYQLLMTARRVKYVFLSGTPLINYPYEVAILLNIIRGYSRTLQIPIRKDSSDVTIRELELNLRVNVPSINRVEYKRGKLYVTRNPKGFISLWNLDKYKGVIGDEAMNAEKTIEEISKSVVKEITRNRWKISGEINTINNTVFPEILEEARKLPDTKSGLLNIKKGRENAIRNFESLFIKGSEGIKNTDLFMRRILGLVSYYKRVNRSDWFPTTLNPDGSLWKAEEGGKQIKIKMSGLQLEKYVEVRDIERERDKANQRSKDSKKALKAEIEGQAKKTSSLYRILSRQHCNFVFPGHISRPRPHKQMILEDYEEGEVVEVTEYTEQLEEAINGLCRVHLMTKKNPLRDILLSRVTGVLEESGNEISNAIIPKLEQSLEDLSPKFVSILDNINGAPGLSFLYSQFRSVEGIEIFSRVLNSNGYGRYSDEDSVIELFDMVEVILEKSKKKFHTGMVVDMKYLNEDKPYYKKLGKKMIEMEVEDRLDELVIQELQKCKKIYDTKGVIGVLKKRIKGRMTELWKVVKEEGYIATKVEFEADCKAIKGGVKSCKVRCSHGSSEKWFNMEELTRSRFALWTGTEDPEEREVIRERFNLVENKMGNIIKVLMITSSGAEGISLMNVRGVHIMEPYWNRVRIEQVIGRAARIKSHVELDKHSQNVTVFEYIVGLTPAQKKKPIASNVVSKDMGFTSDEVLYQISDIKSKVLYGLLTLLKRAAIDCNFNEIDNRASGDDNECYGFIEGEDNQYSNTLSIYTDERDEYKKKRLTKKVDKYREIRFDTPFKNKKGKRIKAKLKIKLERGDEKLNPSTIDGIRLIYNYYKNDKVPVGVIYKGVPKFIKRKYMLKYLNGEFPRENFNIKRHLNKMRLNSKEGVALIKPWINAENGK